MLQLTPANHTIAVDANTCGKQVSQRAEAPLLLMSVAFTLFCCACALLFRWYSNLKYCFSFLLLQLDWDTDRVAKNNVGRLHMTYNMLLKWNMWIVATAGIGRECSREEWLSGMTCAA